jgi:hypothetical protein
VPPFTILLVFVFAFVVVLAFAVVSMFDSAEPELAAGLELSVQTIAVRSLEAVCIGSRDSTLPRMHTLFRSLE